MQKITSLTTLLLLIGLPAAALSQNTNNDSLALALKAGSLGLGLELTFPLTERVNLRASYNDLPFDTDIEDTDVNYDGEFAKTSGGVLLDWHPFDGAFRLSTGFFAHSDNQINLTATPNGALTFEFNGNVYDATAIGSITGDVEFGTSVPYLGLGWGNASQSGGKWRLVVDLGVQFQDSPNVDLGITNCNLPNIPDVSCSDLDDDIQAEINELESELEDYDFWPVFNIGLSYRF